MPKAQLFRAFEVSIQQLTISGSRQINNTNENLSRCSPLSSKIKLVPDAKHVLYPVQTRSEYDTDISKN